MTTNLKIKSAIFAISSLFFVGCDADSTLASENLNEVAPIDVTLDNGEFFEFTPDDGSEPFIDIITISGVNTADVNTVNANTTFDYASDGALGFTGTLIGANSFEENLEQALDTILTTDTEDTITARNILLNTDADATPDFSDEEFEELANILGGLGATVFINPENSNQLIAFNTATYDLTTTGTFQDRLNGVSSGLYTLTSNFVTVTFVPDDFTDDEGNVFPLFIPTFTDTLVNNTVIESGTYILDIAPEFTPTLN